MRRLMVLILSWHLVVQIKCLGAGGVSLSVCILTQGSKGASTGAVLLRFEGRTMPIL